MVNKDILQGLRFAVQRGDSLEKAMHSFFNSGYLKEEIEEAARMVHQKQNLEPEYIKNEVKSETPSKNFSQASVIPVNNVPQSAYPQQSIQHTSSYGESQKIQEKKPSNKLAVILIIVALIALGLGISFLIFGM